MRLIAITGDIDHSRLEKVKRLVSAVNLSGVYALLYTLEFQNLVSRPHISLFPTNITYLFYN